MKKLHFIILFALVLTACQGNKLQKVSDSNIQTVETESTIAVTSPDLEVALPQEEKDAVTNITKELAALKQQLKEQYGAYAASSDKLHQLVDIAMLAAGQLKGEALAKFVNRSVELL